MKKILSLTFFLVLVTVSCNNSEQDILNQTVHDEPSIQLRSCWWCIAEDVLGILEGVAIGSAGGPIGSAVGGAVIGAYRSAKEYNQNGGRATPADDEDYLEVLASNYQKTRPSNPYNYHGILHNKVLHSLILNKDNLNSRQDHYDHIIEMLSTESEFQGYAISNIIEQAILDGMGVVDDGDKTPLSNTHQELYDDLENAFKTGDETIVMNLISESEITFGSDVTAMLALSTAYHTWHFWKNLEN